MEKSWFNLILSKGELEYRCGLSKSMDSLGPIENTSKEIAVPLEAPPHSPGQHLR